MLTVLVIIPYEDIYPPMNGGMLRCFHLLRQLSKNFKVTAIINQKGEEFLKSRNEYPELENCEIISTYGRGDDADIFSLLPGKIAKALRFRYWKRSLNGPAEGNFLRYFPILIDLLRKHHFDVIILENLGTLHSAPVIKRESDAFIIYDAHNVDSLLASSNLFTSKDSLVIRRQIQKAESSLYKLVHGVIACSKSDLAAFMQMNHQMIKGAVIPNGVRIQSKRQGIKNSTGQRNNLIFCGSLDYEPNREGLWWFCIEVLPKLRSQSPSIELTVVGKGDPGEPLKNVLRSPGVLFHGAVDDLETYYEKANLAIVPLFTGSGTRLKVLEAMSYQVPVISTAKGAEGIDYTVDKNICLAERAKDFCSKILDLLNNEDKADYLAAEAYKLVRDKYDWDIIGKELTSFLIENSFAGHKLAHEQSDRNNWNK